MSFLKRFMKNSHREGQVTTSRSSFENLTEEELEAHLGVSRYGEFELTDAIRPSYDLQVVPRTGFRHDCYQDRETGVQIPVVMAAASRRIVLDLFMDLLDPIGESVDVVLESSHDRAGHGHVDLFREQIDLPVLKSILYDYEDLLLNDGCMGIAVLNSKKPVEVQFDEHKLLIIYGHELSEFENVLIDNYVDCNEDLQFITEAEHVHSSSEENLEEFEQLRYRLGIDD